MEYTVAEGWRKLESLGGVDIMDKHPEFAGFYCVDEDGSYLATFRTFPEALAFAKGVARGWKLAEWHYTDKIEA